MTSEKKSKRNVKTILVLFLLSAFALGLRLTYIKKTYIDKPVRADARSYVIYGYNLANHGTFSTEFPSEKPTPDSYRSPGYPFVLALVYLLGGEKHFLSWIIMLQVVLSALMVSMTFYLAIRYLTFWWSTAAAVLVAISPHLITMTSYFLTETLFGFMMLAALVTFTRAIHEWRIFFFVGASILFGYAYFTNETTLFVPFLLVSAVVIIYWKDMWSPERNRMIACLSVFLLLFALFPAAWRIRNAISLPPGASTGGGRALQSLSYGTYPRFIYKSKEYRNYPYKEDPMQPAFSESLHSFASIFWSRFKERPLRYIIWYFVEKPYYFWSWNIIQGQGDVYIYPVITSLYQTSETAEMSRKLMKAIHPVLLVILFLSIPLYYLMLRSISRRKSVMKSPVFIFITLVYFTFLYSVFTPLPRYSIPFRPEMYVLALWTLNAGITFSVTRTFFPVSEVALKSVPDSKKHKKRHK